MLRGRIPRFQEKVVDAGVIDGADRGVGIGIRGEQCPLRPGEYPHSFLQEFDPVHARHALVGKEQSHVVITHLQLLQEVKCAFRRIASDDTISSAVLRTKIALYRPQNIGVVIHTQQNWFGHDRSQLFAHTRVPVTPRFLLDTENCIRSRNSRHRAA